MPNKMKLLLFVLLSPCICYCQVPDMFYDNTKLNEINKNTLFLKINNLNFFKDNEFKSTKTSGYTLPGFILEPKLSYQLYDNILLEAGVHMLHYWGADTYPCYAYTDISSWKAESYQKGLRIMPLLRAQINMNDNLSLVFGNIYRNNNHNLILPLYNSELHLADPENGVQMLFDSKYFEADLWLNWESFIFRYDTHQEVFTLGFSSKIHLTNPDNRFKLYVPLQAIIQHRGGEIDTIANDTLSSLVNGAYGLGLSYDLNTKVFRSIALELYHLGFKELTGNTLFFQQGMAFYPKITLDMYDFKLRAAYFYSKDFITILGSPYYGNLSNTTQDYNFLETNMINLSLEYLYAKKRNFSLGFEFETFYQFKTPVFRPGYVDVEGEGSFCFSIGAYLRINPSFKIFTYKK